ncbi:MAG: hypothetical protein ACE5E1_00905 [Phycisphaerae bacterium]
MLDPIGSTSWHHRHLACFRKLDEILRAAALDEPTVLLVGPGGVTCAAAPMLNDAAEDACVLRRLLGDAARYSDQVLRRIPGMPLRSLEPVELAKTLSVPHRLIVADRSQRVLAAVSRDLPGVTCHCVDISFQPLPVRAEVVIAFNIISRLGDGAATGVGHVVEAVLPGGWLLMDDRSADAHLGVSSQFTRVAPKTYRRSC